MFIHGYPKGNVNAVALFNFIQFHEVIINMYISSPVVDLNCHLIPCFCLQLMSYGRCIKSPIQR
ncbi:hypothetical protein XSR1_340055 [Xenorhabdus szentirmaii DSM 16338]|uniref:Uncharacterized protein n=1 Tax=Xenorhabdus szentirmaii DSM 16338 TaxID=1427518 RepID=W1J2G6_9GAMM|nr:hypothetical protein XSR1_340055 [Xenorhabdus szentirmaii DSM 16338]